VDRPCITRVRDKKYIQNLSWKPERKTAGGRLRCKWEDNIKMILEKLSLMT
jgi:hypothetical protein